MIRAFTLGMCLVAAAPAAWSQAANYPNRPIKLIVPFGPGGFTDVVARVLGQKLGQAMNTSFVIENKPGAGSTIGTAEVAKAAPDGYTLLMHNISFPLSYVAQSLANRSPFNAETDFAGVSIAVYVPFVLTANPAVPAKDLRELANLLKANKSLQYNYGSTGPGTAVHVLGEAFKRDAKVEMEHVPFKGAAPLKQELLSGRIQIGGDQLSSSLAEIRNGSLRAIATTASKRIGSLPDVPTVRELGFASLELEGWNGVFAPAKTPKDIIERLQKEIAAAVRNPEVMKRLADLGADPVGSTPAEQDAMLRRQMDQFRSVIRDMKLD
jgi:tripartite-type tricarboxylate transporter receptor subunit TctC